MAEISNANISPNLDSEQLENEHSTLILLAVDESGSMNSYTDVMQDSIRKFKQSLQNSKQEDEILVSLLRFNGNINGSGFQLINDIPADYSPSGMTCLYDAIISAQRRIFSGDGKGYMEELRAKGIRTKGVIAIFSDGEDTSSISTIREAADAIAMLQKNEIIVAFVAFGDPAKGIAQQLGIPTDNVLEVSASESELRRVFDVLSKSAISASKNTASSVNSNTFFI
jgi:hypothetical protein